MTVIKFPEKHDVTTEDAWKTYVQLATKANETMRFEDGIAAGKAWGRFVTRFVHDHTPGGPAA
ncbi:hypothetical protein [Sinorhizobium meliloti]|uniref:hypothetical protein n=1 Tax=Rhizobium meliloti TaxID=382 RepID=UPI0003F831A7|nr:hypothetical protein [Sinorhizobium meliloti]MDE4621716.1 hypothetical protein [Sinorhizobium meliloti]